MTCQNAINQADRKVKLKKCRVCKEQFMPFRSTQVICTEIECAVEYGKRTEEKKRKREQKALRKELRERKEKLKTVSDLIKELQPIFNKYIRLRDENKPCISCNRSEHEIKHDPRGGKWDAGHYRSRGCCPELRFEELNVHKQCVKCNQYKSGNANDYRIN